MSFDEFARTVAGAYGVDGEAWLARLPDLLRECRERWELVGDRISAGAAHALTDTGTRWTALFA
jgi:hypothetical protein